MSNASDFIIENGVLKKYVGPGGDAVIPEEVTAIGSYAFFICKSLTSVVFSANIQSIASYAFYECDNLRDFAFSDQVSSTDAPSLKSTCFYFSGSDYDIAFGYSLLKHGTAVVLQNGSVRKIIKANKKRILETIIENDDAAAMEKFLSMYKVVKLEDLEKYIAKANSSVSVSAYLIKYKQERYPAPIQDVINAEKTEKALGLRELSADDWKKIFSVWPYLYKKKNGLMITSYKGTATFIEVPTQIGDMPVLAIDADAFSPEKKVSRNAKEIRDKITCVILPEGVVSICGNKGLPGAFCNCRSLKEIVLPSTLVEIGQCAFRGCESLTAIEVPANVKTIGEQAFDGCVALSVIKIPEKVKK